MCFFQKSTFTIVHNSAVQIENTVTPFLSILSFYNQCMPRLHLHLFPKFDEKLPQNNKK